MKGLLLAVAGLTAAFLSSASAAVDPSCFGCHALVKPSDASMDRLLTRKGPDLWFKKEWLVSWLQDPKPIRPAGYPRFNTVKKGDKNDVPDPSKIAAHPKLKRADAEAAAEALMALKAPADLVSAGISSAVAPLDHAAR